MSFETALGLTPHQLTMLYEARTRVLAAQRAAYADDVAAAIGGSLSEEGHKALQAHLRALRAVANGQDPEAAASYTEGAIVL